MIARHGWMGAAVAVGLAVLAAAGCGSQALPDQGSATALGAGRVAGFVPANGSGQPADFISVRPAPGSGSPDGEAVSVTSLRTGKVVRTLLASTLPGRVLVTGLALDRSGNLWVTYSRGAECSGNINGCGPKPHTCGAEIRVLHLATGRFTTFLRTGPDTELAGAAPNPAGTLLAYRESGCVLGYFNDHLRIMNLRTRRSWTIGAALPRCHLLTNPRWSADGRSLVLGYAPAVGPRYRGPANTCASPGREELVQVSAAAPQPGLSGRAAQAGAGCEVSAAAGLAGGGAAAVESCGPNHYLSGPVRVIIYNPALRPVRSIPLGRCADGADAAADPAGRSLLVSAYLYCNPPGVHGPVSRVWLLSPGRSGPAALRPVLSTHTDAEGVVMMTW